MFMSLTFQAISFMRKILFTLKIVTLSIENFLYRTILFKLFSDDNGNIARESIECFQHAREYLPAKFRFAPGDIPFV